MTDDPIESRLRRYRPAAPPDVLRRRVLAAAAREARRPTAPAWMAWAAAAVATTCMATAVWFTAETARLDARLSEEPPAARAAVEYTLRSLDLDPETRASLLRAMERARRDAEARLRQMQGLPQ